MGQNHHLVATINTGNAAPTAAGLPENHSSRVGFLFDKQKGRCSFCKEGRLWDDILEVDHVDPKHKGGLDDWKNLQLLLSPCLCGFVLLVTCLLNISLS